MHTPLLELKNIGKIYVSEGNVAVGIRGVNLSIPLMTLSRVDLPDPDLPVTATNSPRSKDRLTPRMPTDTLDSDT